MQTVEWATLDALYHDYVQWCEGVGAMPRYLFYFKLSQAVDHGLADYREGSDGPEYNLKRQKDLG